MADCGRTSSSRPPARSLARKRKNEAPEMATGRLGVAENRFDSGVVKGEREVVLGDYEDRVRGLTELAGANLNDEVRKVILELVQLDVVPTAIAQVLKSLCNKQKQQKQFAA